MEVIIKMYFEDVGIEGIDWILVPENGDRWAVVNWRFLQIGGIPLVAGELSASQEGLCSVQLAM